MVGEGIQYQEDVFVLEDEDVFLCLPNFSRVTQVCAFSAGT